MSLSEVYTFMLSFETRLINQHDTLNSMSGGAAVNYASRGGCGGRSRGHSSGRGGGRSRGHSSGRGGGRNGGRSGHGSGGIGGNDCPLYQIFGRPQPHGRSMLVPI
jgi:hypothetical protein